MLILGLRPTVLAGCVVVVVLFACGAYVWTTHEASRAWRGSPVQSLTLAPLPVQSVPMSVAFSSDNLTAVFGPPVRWLGGDGRRKVLYDPRRHATVVVPNDELFGWRVAP